MEERKVGMASKLIRVILVLLAVLLGFTFLSLFSVHHDRSTQPSSSQQISSKETAAIDLPEVAVQPGVLTASSVVRRRPGGVRWRQYGHVEGMESVNEWWKEKGEPQPQLHSIPAQFQEQIMNGISLQCHPGKEGLFKEKYSRFLHVLQHYVDFHHGLKHSPSPSRTLTWHCPTQDYCGGLGDRIRGVTYALLLAIFSRRQLVIFWEGPPEGAYLKPHMVDWRDKVVYEFMRNNAAGKNEMPESFEAPFMFSFKVVLTKQGKIVNDVSESDMSYYQRIIASNKTNVIISTNLEPCSLLDSKRNGNQDWIRSGLIWSGLAHLLPSDLDDTVGLVFRYLFKLREDILDEVMAAREVLGLMGPYTALHLRTGFASMNHHEELMRHPKLQQNVSVWQTVLHCAVKAANHFLGNNSLVYLATDSNLVKEMAVTQYPQRFRTLKNSLVHVDKLGKSQHQQLEPREEGEGVVVVWVELLILAQAKVLVKGESGYSWTSGLLCGMHGNRTISTTKCT